MKSTCIRNKGKMRTASAVRIFVYKLGFFRLFRFCSGWALHTLAYMEGGADMGQRQRERSVWSGTRFSAAVGMGLAVGLFFLPAIVVEPMQGGETLPALPAARSEAPQAAQTVGGSRDRGRIVRLARTDGQVEELTMEDYLWGVVAAEMPAAFEPEALKAQAAAARTYTVELQNSPEGKHPDADLCEDSGCCQAYVDRQTAQARWGLQAGSYTKKIAQAVAQTDGLGVLYQEEPIQAVFFSSSAGRTADAAEVWGSSVDYLKSVESPEGEEVPNYRSRVVLTVEQVRQMVLERYPGADLSGAASGWFSDAEYNSAGGVDRMWVGGISVSGSQLRTLFSLRSAVFTITLEENQFVFDVTGYGHGVGMSQYGANAMARQGADFEQILTWYYTGTQVGPLWK